MSYIKEQLLNRLNFLFSFLYFLSCDYVQGIALTHANLHFSKKILTPYQILYTLLAYMYKLIKDIKYKLKNSHTMGIPNAKYVLIIACKLIECIET